MTLSALYGIAIVAAFFSFRSVAETLTMGGLVAPSPAPWLYFAAVTSMSDLACNSATAVQHFNK